MSKGFLSIFYLRDLLYKNSKSFYSSLNSTFQIISYEFRLRKEEVVNESRIYKQIDHILPEVRTIINKPKPLLAKVPMKLFLINNHKILIVLILIIGFVSNVFYGSNTSSQTAEEEISRECPGNRIECLMKLVDKELNEPFQ